MNPTPLAPIGTIEAVAWRCEHCDSIHVTQADGMACCRCSDCGCAAIRAASPGTWRCLPCSVAHAARRWQEHREADIRSVVRALLARKLRCTPARTYYASTYYDGVGPACGTHFFADLDYLRLVCERMGVAVPPFVWATEPIGASFNVVDHLEAVAMDELPDDGDGWVDVAGAKAFFDRWNQMQPVVLHPMLNHIVVLDAGATWRLFSAVMGEMDSARATAKRLIADSGLRLVEGGAS